MFVKQRQKSILAVISWILVCFLALPASGQIARLTNPSFEGEPQDATIPQNWLICQEGTTPDILPGPWGVYNEPFDGDTYVGLITRENGTWESIGQRLSTPLLSKTCYKINFKLAHSQTYAGYAGPLKLRIWGGKQICKKDLLIGLTEFVDHADWKNYEFEFETKGRIYFITIEAFYSDRRFSYKGNILIDDISVIRPCSGA